MQMKNYMEDLVWQRLDEFLINNPGACNCEKCRYDIASLALNSLPARYIVTSAGEAYTKTKALESQFNIDIITAITKAFQVVQNNPHHDSRQA